MKPSLLVDERQVGLSGAWVAVLGITISLVMVVAGTMPPAARSSRGLHDTDPMLAAVSLITSNDIANEVNNAYMSIQGASPGASSLPTQASVDMAIAGMYSAVSKQSSFLTALGTYSQQNFSFQLGFDTTVGISSASFVFQWTTGNTSYMESWSGNLATGVVTGPGTCTHRAISATGTGSRNWDGFEYYVGSSGNPAALGTANTDTTVVNFAQPPQNPQGVPQGTTIDPVATAWAALEVNPGGSQGLLQAGYLMDVNWSTTTYYPFYEFWPFQSTVLYYNNSYNPSSGDIENIVVNRSQYGGGSYTMKVFDNTKGHGNIATEQIGTRVLKYSANIVEAFSFSGWIQQIAKFWHIQFEDGVVYTTPSNTAYHQTALYNSSSYNWYYLTQQSGTTDVGQWYVMQSGYYGIYGYTESGWYTSAYVCHFVNSLLC